MQARASEAGALLPNRAQTVTVPNITDGDTADVDLAADAAFAGGAVRVPVVVTFGGLPLANLGIVGAWVKTPSTGVVTVRFSALTGNVSTDDQPVIASRVA